SRKQLAAEQYKHVDMARELGEHNGAEGSLEADYQAASDHLNLDSGQVDTSLLSQYPGSTCELDSQSGLYNPGMQWLASGVLEWVR
ncbi:hypothetical protein MJN85_29075, partial [Salmonella enterica subsp. enterica serovar Anatum]|nr:hypothetical protein [Salmonella enterica subsp. enterica serovar Anatum]